MPKSLVLLAALLAGPAFVTPAAAAGMPSLRDYREAKATGGAEAARADGYVDGALHAILVVDEALRSGDASPFCIDAAHFVDGAPDVGRIRREFTAWLDDPEASGSGLPETQDAPISMFAFGFFAKTFACADAESEMGDLDSVLRRTLPQ